MFKTAKLKCQIVTSADVNFLPAACCMLISANEALGANKDVTLTLVAVDVSESEAEKANCFLEAHGVRSCVRPVSSAELIDPRLPVNKRVTKASYVRLALQEIVSPGVDRVLYLDADMRVMSELAPLLEADMRGFPLAAVNDILLYQRDWLAQTWQRLSMPQQADYFNAGVLLFDWPGTIQSGLLDRATAFACANPTLCVMHDQDALNVAAAENWKPLDPRWNMLDYYFRFSSRHAARIKHFTGPKPWSRRRRSIWQQDAEWMRRLLQDSPWPTFVEKQTWRDRLSIIVEDQWNRRRHYRRLIGYYLVPFLMSPAARQRAREYLQYHRKHVENLVADLIHRAET